MTTEEFIEAGTEIICLYELLLDNINKLERSKYYKQRVKYTGSLFISELGKEIDKFYKIAKDEESQKVLYSKINQLKSKLS